MKLDITREELIRVGISDFTADRVVSGLEALGEVDDPMDTWCRIVHEVLQPYVPFAAHKLCYEKVASLWDSAALGPMPAYIPSVARQQCSNIHQVMETVGLTDYDAFYAWSIAERELFWGTMTTQLGIRFDRPYSAVYSLDQGAHAPRWLPDARMNIVESCFQADPEATAVVYRRGPDEPVKRVTYGALAALVDRVAAGVAAAGFQPGDALAVDMIMNLESVAIYLGIIKAGCVVISIADSFTPPEIATRLRIGKAVGIFTMDHVLRDGKRLPMYEKVCAADAPRAVVLPCEETLSVSLRSGDVAFDAFLVETDAFQAVYRDPEDTVNILFSSGTTGDPKAIPWNHTTPIKAASDGYLHQNIGEDTVVCWPTNLGWMMGPWLVFATLINKGAIGLYYGAPTSAGFCAFVGEAEVGVLGVVPSIVKAWRNNDAAEGCHWHRLSVFSSTGECSAPDDMLYLMSLAGYQPVIEYCGGTEIGGGYVTGTVVQPGVPSTFSTPALGTELVILDEDGCPADTGEVYLVPPVMGLSNTLLNKDHFEQYYADTPTTPDGRTLRRHGDQLARLAGGYLRAHGRADDTMNLGGIKVGSAEIERVLKEVEVLDEIAAVAVSPPDGGPSLLVVFVTLKRDREEESLKTGMQAVIRTKLNPLFKIHEVVVVDSLPRTASGKVMRRLLRKQYQDRD